MQKILSTQEFTNRDAVSLTLDYVRNVIKEEGSFEGVIRASEGASAAATVLMDEVQTSSRNGCPNPMEIWHFLCRYSRPSSRRQRMDFE